MNPNPVIAFPAAKPALKLLSAADRAESVAASQAQERQTLEQDQEALRDLESNLREYEVRLREWQSQIENGLQHPPQVVQYIPAAPAARALTGAPFDGDVGLQTGWEKLHRARELLEAEQSHLRDDRLNLKETAAVLKRHEAALVAREASLGAREDVLAVAAVAHLAEPVKQPSAIARFTSAPFAIAKSVFGSKAPIPPAAEEE